MTKEFFSTLEHHGLSKKTEAIPIGFVKIPVSVNYFSWDDFTGCGGVWEGWFMDQVLMGRIEQ